MPQEEVDLAALPMPKDQTESLMVLIAVSRSAMTLMEEVGGLRGNRLGAWTAELEARITDVVRASVPDDHPEALGIAQGLVRLLFRRLRMRLRSVK